MTKFKDTFKKEWIQVQIVEETTEWAKGFGEELNQPEKEINQKTGKEFVKRKALSTSQLRKFFGELKRLETDFERKSTEIVMLKPMLAYAVGRDKGETKISDFNEVLVRAIDSIRNSENRPLEADFKRFVKLFEAIVAYHKFYGGK